MDKVSLTASMRSNLLSLQNISRQVDATQNRLSTGKKVNSAIDNPSSYYTARALTNRANDLDALLDSMGQAVSTIKAATTSLETAAGFLEQASAVATQALESAERIYIRQPSGISDDAAIRDTSLFDGRANTQAMLDQMPMPWQRRHVISFMRRAWIKMMPILVRDNGIFPPLVS